jgi:hypothetical protein
VPGTGRALAFGGAGGNAFAGTLAGVGAVGAACCPGDTPGAAGLIAGLIEALGGTGSLPCWISEAFCAAAAGSAGPAPTGGTPGPAPPLAADGGAAALGRAAGSPRPAGAAGGGCGGWLMTVLMTVVLWMLVKMMLFGGGAT